MRTKVELKCSECQKVLRYDPEKKAMACPTEGCPKKGLSGATVHLEEK